MQSINAPRKVQSIDTEDALEALESEPIFEELGGRMIKFGMFEATKMGHETLVSHASGESVTIPTSEIDKRLN